MVDYDKINSSDIAPEVPAGDDSSKDPENVLRGHKATINNPRTYSAPCLPSPPYPFSSFPSSPTTGN